MNKSHLWSLIISLLDRISPTSFIITITLIMTAPSHAGFITGAASVINAPTPISGFLWELTIDQSGLTTGYTSGVTDFDSYVAGDPMSLGTNIPGNYAASFSGTGPVDYDLGSTMDILQLAFWQYPFQNSGGVAEFNAYTSNDPTFTTSTLVGNFMPSDNGAEFSPPGTLVQVFDLADSFARYLRIDVLSTAGPSGMGWSEIAFDVVADDVTAVPVPAAVWLFGSGLLGLIGIARRKKSA